MRCVYLLYSSDIGGSGDNLEEHGEQMWMWTSEQEGKREEEEENTK